MRRSAVHLLAWAVLAGSLAARVAADTPAPPTPPPPPARPMPPAKPVAQPLADEDKWPRPLRAVLERPRAAPGSDFAGQVLVDILAADDGWGDIAAALDEALARHPQKARYLEVRNAPAPLLTALESRPALVVLGSTRRFQAAEAIAVAHYVSLGGRVLALVRASPDYTVRVVDANVVLRELRVVASLGRPAGPTVLGKHPLTEGLAALPPAGAGVGFWSLLATPVVCVANTPFCCALEPDRGRALFLDGQPLTLKPTQPPHPGESPGRPFAPLLDRALAWLLK